MKHFFVILFFLSLNTFNSFAQVDQNEGESKVYLSNDHFSEYIIADLESGSWHVRVYRANHGDLQDLVIDKTFTTSQQAFEFQQKYIKIFNEKYPVIDDDFEGESDLPVAAIIVDDSSAVTEVEGTQIWNAKNRWNNDWEEQYGKWIQEKLSPEYFSKFNIKTDCADVVIGLRWIFARLNGLPVLNTLSGSMAGFGNMSMKKAWINLKRDKVWHKDQLFRAALEYIMKNTYTRSLSTDSYPIKIDAQTFFAGIHHLEFHSEGGHAMIVKKVKTSKGLFGGGSTKITVMDSTLPRKVRNLSRKGYFHGLTPERGSGFLRMRWPVYQDGHWYLLEKDSHPYYSTEQYNPNFITTHGSFAAAIKGTLSGTKNISAESFRITLLDVRKQLTSRANVVYDGFYACQEISCSRGSRGWQQWSTPVRDNRLFGIVEGVLNVVKIQKKNSKIINLWNEFLKKKVTIDRGTSIKIRTMIKVISTRSFSSDPRDSIAKRWAILY